MPVRQHETLNTPSRTAERERVSSRPILAFAGAVGGSMVALALTASHRSFVAPTLLFWVVVVAASLCVVTALIMAAVAWRRDLAELGYGSAFFIAVSVLPLVHGLTTPGVLYGPNTATAASVYWAVPVGSVALAPIAVRRRSIGRAIGRHWKGWCSVHVIATTTVAALMLAWPDFVAFPAMGSALARVTTVGFFTVATIAAVRQARLSRIAQRRGPAIIGVAFVLVGASSLVFVAPGPWTPHFWLAHVVDIAGVFLGTIGGALVYLREGSARSVLTPVLAVDPHAALEIGLSPVVHEFVAELEAKDTITRDHVVRTAELAIDCAHELGLDADAAREAGLVALLHDVGKVTVPDDVLTKPGRLTDDEFAIMSGHAAAGAEMVAAAPGLESLAPGVGAHHERYDGAGYPAGLEGDEIPTTARICAACDAFDAMSATRHYREAMDPSVVRGVLEEHAGAQWDPTVVDALLRVIGHRPWQPVPRTALRDVGRVVHPHDAHDRLGCDCVPDLEDAGRPAVAARHGG